LTRAIELADEGLIPAADATRWRTTADQIRTFVETKCWSEERRAYRFYAGDDLLDASVLLCSRFRFEPPTGPRLGSTISALQNELARGPFLYRFSGKEKKEGAFLACTFWLIEALAESGRIDEATALMERALTAGNDVGLFSEEFDPDSGELLGNFPQLLTHLSLINAAVDIQRAQQARR
jgi:GH15 family glucan-1,4-alpha-glucosidase